MTPTPTPPSLVDTMLARALKGQVGFSEEVKELCLTIKSRDLKIKSLEQRLRDAERVRGAALGLLNQWNGTLPRDGDLIREAISILFTPERPTPHTPEAT